MDPTEEFTTRQMWMVIESILEDIVILQEYVEGMEDRVSELEDKNG